MYRNTLALVAAGLLSAATLNAQSTGDVILTASNDGGGGAYSINPATGSQTTLRAGFRMRGATMAHGNQHLITIGALSGDVYRFLRSGTYTTLTTLSDGLATAVELDQDASLLLCQSWERRLLRIHNNGALATLTEFAASLGAPSSICRDQDTGHFVVGFSSGRLIRVHRVTGSQTTVASGLTAVEGVAYSPINGYFIAACQGGLKFVRRNGTVSHTVPLTDLGAVAIDPRNSKIYAVQRSGGKLYHVSAFGFLVKTQNVPLRTYHGLTVWGSRIVSVNTTGGGASTTVSLRFLRSRRNTYCAALSLGNRVGIGVGTVGTINLAADPLFFLTACGGYPAATNGFSGRTRLGGIAGASFQLPALPSGTVIYVGAVAVNGTLPGGLDFMNSEAVRID